MLNINANNINREHAFLLTLLQLGME